VSWKGINLTILIIITRESLQSNLLSSQLGHGDLLGSLLLRSKLLLLLGSKLLRCLLSKLLGILSKLLILLELLLELAWLLLSKLLLLRSLLSKLLVLLELLLKLTWLLLSKLLLLRPLLSKLLGILSKLLVLLEVPEVLIEVLGVELLRGGSAGVEVGSIEHWSPGSLLLSVVGEGLSLGTGVVLCSDPLLFLNHSFLEG
jgi:hypothetical protein